MCEAVMIAKINYHRRIDEQTGVDNDSSCLSIILVAFLSDMATSIDQDAKPQIKQTNPLSYIIVCFSAAGGMGQMFSFIVLIGTLVLAVM